MTRSTKDLARELGCLRKRSSTNHQRKERLTKTRQLFSYLVVLDFESTCWQDARHRTQEIIEFPAVLLNTSTGEIEAEFQYYVQPQENPILSEFCRELTGISQDQVDEGIPLSLVLSKFSQWLKKHSEKHGFVYNSSADESANRCTFVTWSDWDLGVCLLYEARRKQLRKPAELNSWIDLRATYRSFYERRPKGLNGALQDVGLDFEGREHSGLHDSRNTARLAYRMMCDGCVLNITKTIQGPPSSKKPSTCVSTSTSIVNRSSTSISTVNRSSTSTFTVISMAKPSTSTQNRLPISASASKKLATGATPSASTVVNKTPSLASAVSRAMRASSASETKRLSIPTPAVNSIPGYISGGSGKGNTRQEGRKRCSVGITRNTSVLGTFSNGQNMNLSEPIAPHRSHSSVNSVSNKALVVASHLLRSPPHKKNKIQLTSNFTVYKDPTPAPVHSAHVSKAPAHKQNKIQPISNFTVYKDPAPAPVHSADISRSPLRKKNKIQVTSNFTVYKDPTPAPVPSTRLTDVTNTAARRVQAGFAGKQTPSNKSAMFKTPLNPVVSGKPSICQPPNNSTFKTPFGQVLPLRPSSMKATPPMCSCGRRAKRRFVQAVGPNQGRAFFCCGIVKHPNKLAKGCNFFKWEPDSPSLGTSPLLSSAGKNTPSIQQFFVQKQNLRSSLISHIPQPDFSTPQSNNVLSVCHKKTAPILNMGL